MQPQYRGGYAPQQGPPPGPPPGHHLHQGPPPGPPPQQHTQVPLPPQAGGHHHHPGGPPGPRGGGGGQHHVTVPQPRRGGIGPMMSAGPAHHQLPMTQAQIQQESHRREAVNHLAKLRSRKPTDKTLPDGIEEILVGGPDLAVAYKKLRDFERRLDATMSRKRLDIVDSVSRNAKRYKTLRVWITNTVEDQYWQNNNFNVDSFDFPSNLESTYRVKIEGRLLDDEDETTKDDEEDGDKMDTSEDNTNNTATKSGAKPVPAKPGQRYRFSHFFKALTVDFDQPTASGRLPVDTVEWKKPERIPAGSNLPASADFDELTFKRHGDENVNITINLYRHEDPERYELSLELSDVLDMSEATRQEAVAGLFEYIKLFKLQEDDEKRNFRCDELLQQLIGRESGHIPQLNDYVTPHLKPLPPIKLPYTIRVDQEFHSAPDAPKPTIYDIRVSVDDPLRSKHPVPFIHDPSYAQTLREIQQLDESLAVLIQAICDSKAKHTFMTSMEADPVGFVKKWLSSQKRDLEVIMGEATRAGAAAEDPVGDEWRRGGKGSVWDTMNAKESVNLLLSKQGFAPAGHR
ncbi:SWI-SNF complex subunit [Pseudoneurospora amorphoporcata]|uniref:SWI-SNF complex subunit n=1 Tax=Pseudoneurospora amorphoporcata TaxID=241081 RepID=A0AAN6NQR6_9PEZI|nr:SWI-SNF complex subunit [Pseudoneurospora amorphoporcata]